MKTCIRCERSLPVSEFHVRKAAKDGLNPYCRSCTAASAAAFRAANPEWFKAYYAKNKEKSKAKAAAWYAANPERMKAYRAANKERAKAATASWNAANSEWVRVRNAAWRAANKDRVRATNAAWAKANAEKRADGCQQRRVRIKGGVVEKIDRRAIYDRDNGECHLCGKHVPEKEMELDHLIPVSRGGDHVALNLRVSCRSCNRRRGAGRLPAQLIIC